MTEITVPTLCINSLNDPIFPEWVIPKNLFERNSNAILLTFNGGGHCGFLHGPNGDNWDYICCLDFLNETLRFLYCHKK